MTQGIEPQGGDSLNPKPYIASDDPCLTCYAEDCIHRRKTGQQERSKKEYAAIFPAPYICDAGGHSICESHWHLAVIAGWNPRKKDEVFT